MTDSVYEEQISIRLTEKTPVKHLLGIIKFAARDGATFGSVIVSVVALAEVLVAVVGTRPSLVSIVLPAMIAAAAIVLYRAQAKYRTHVPDELASESRFAQSTFRRQRFGWQWSLCGEMLLTRTRELDAELERIRRGAEYVEPKNLATNEYIDWVKERLDAIRRLMNAVTIQITSYVPASVGVTTSEEGLAEMKVRIEGLADLYATTVSFERDCQAVVPPAEFRSIHQTTEGWTDPIRTAMQDFVDIVGALSRLDKKRVGRGLEKPPEFKIKVNSAPSLDEFVRKLDQFDT